MHRILAAIALSTLLVAGTACRRDDATQAAPAAQPTTPIPADPEDPDRPPHGRPEIVEMLRADRAATRHPSDGAGRAWLEGDASATAVTPGRWTILYEAGPLGIAEGGMLFLMTSPFWGWSTPQTRDPTLHGYTEVTTTADGVVLETATPEPQLLGVTIQGRALAAGERIRFVFGAGSAQAGADRFAERGERFWLAVDGDGDGVRKTLSESPRLDVAPGPAVRLILTLQSTARVGETARLTAALLDSTGSISRNAGGEVVLDALPTGLSGPATIAIPPDGNAAASVSLRVDAKGIYRLKARIGEFDAATNPLVVDDGPRILWGDLHGHSQLSDGTGTPDDWFTYARDVAGLDVAALTDHDHWGVLFLDEQPDLWESIRSTVKRFHEPGRFVSLLGYEWTSWIHGHRHVVYFDDDGAVHSSIDEATDDPRELWAALAGRPALTFAHHSAGGPVPTNWAIPPDPTFEPVTEVVSVHGSSEALDSPGVIYSPIPGNFVRDVLDRGYVLGFLGSGDGHDGHPGLAHLAATSGGLAAILAPEASREAVLDALRARRSYATNGPRIVVRTVLAGQGMGGSIPVASLPDRPIQQIQVAAPGEVSGVDVVRSGSVVASFEGRLKRDIGIEAPLENLRPGEYVYTRVVQIGGGAAWTSPFFITP
jgi:hypothetical protein